MQRVLDARYRLVRPLGVPARSAIVVLCSVAVVVLVTIAAVRPTGTDWLLVVVAAVLAAIVIVVSPRPFAAPVVINGAGPEVPEAASAQLVAEYANLARRRGRLALVATLERSRSLPGREILAALASSSRYDLAAIRSTLETYRDPQLRPGSAAALAGLAIGWTLELARIMVIQSVSPQETLDAATLYQVIVARAGRDRLSREHQQLFVEALLDSDLRAEAGEITAAWVERTEQDSRLVADSINPFLGRGSDADIPRWLEQVNAGFISAGLEPVGLADGEVSPLDRLWCVPTDRRDETTRITVIITSYRPDRSLVTSVSSVLASSWRNLEVLVIDDASGAEYSGVYAEVAALDDRVRVETLGINQGTYVGRNHGLDLATGDFVTFQDSDDWMHPRRLEVQASHLLTHPDVPANASRSIRVTDLLRFSHHRSLDAKICEPSLMIRREQVVERLGYFDRVRKNGDSEYRRRLQAATGSPVPVLGEVPLTWQRTVAGSLSFTDVGRNWISPARRAYMNCFASWHAQIAAGTASPRITESSSRTSPFYAPPELTDAASIERSFDVLFLSNWLVDGSHGGSQRSNEEEIRALARAGLRVGIIHTEAFWFMHSRDSRLSDRIVRMLNSGEVELVQLDSPTTTELLVIRYPPVLQFAPGVRSQVKAGRVVIVANQGPYDLDGTGRRYDVATCSQRVVTMFGTIPTWAPQGPLVRDVLERLVARANLLDEDVPAILDPDSWRATRSSLAGRRPVVGRYSRDIAPKWPESPETILAAYSSEDFETRVMGGPETLWQVLGAESAWPKNWTVLTEGEQDPRRFLAEIDFFVYFHASYYREAFGRSIVEAMASGLVVILQESFRPVFGEAAVYCAPEDVASVVARLSADQGEYDAQAQRGVAWVDAHSSYSSYVQLVRRLSPALSASVAPRMSGDRKSASVSV